MEIEKKVTEIELTIKLTPNEFENIRVWKNKLVKNDNGVEYVAGSLAGLHIFLRDLLADDPKAEEKEPHWTSNLSDSDMRDMMQTC